MAEQASSVPTLQFRDDKPGLRVDVKRLIAGRLVVQASSGGGKSRAIRYLAEQLHGQVQQFIIDPEGEFSSLREKFDYVIVGDGGDVPADPRHAKVLCRRLLELNASVVFDIYSLKVPQRREYVATLLHALIEMPKSMWRPLLVMIDEAHESAPEGMNPSNTPHLEAVVELVSKGRKRGFCAVLATQRISKLHKDAAEVTNYMVGRTGLDVDVDRAAKSLGFKAEGRMALRSLKDGHFFCHGPAFSTTVIEARTGDVRSYHPEPGEIRHLGTPPAKAAVRDILAHLADVPKEVQKEADEVETLRRRVEAQAQQIGELRRMNADLHQPQPVVDTVAIDQAVEIARGAIVRIYQNKAGMARKAIEQSTARAHRALEQVKQAIIDAEPEIKAGLGAGLGEMMSLEKWGPEGLPPVGVSRGTPVQPRREGVMVHADASARDPQVPFTPKALKAMVGQNGLTAGQQRMLNTLLEFRLMDCDVLDARTLAVYSDISPKSSRVDDNIRALLKLGLIDTTVDGLTLTPEGLAQAQTDSQKPPTATALRERWLAKLPKSQAGMLRGLLHSHPTPMTNSQLAEAAGRSPGSSAVEDDIRNLKNLGLITRPGPSEPWGLTKLLFPRGLRG